MFSSLGRLVRQIVSFLFSLFLSQRANWSADLSIHQKQLVTAIRAVLQQALGEGHTRLSMEAFYERVERTPELRNTQSGDVSDALRTMVRQSEIVLSDHWLAFTRCVVAEQEIASGLAAIGRYLRRIRAATLQRPLADAGTSLSSISGEQRAAVLRLAQARVGILTGAPGTGKSATMKALVTLLERAGYAIHLTAPTGRAAVRLTEATGRPARTLHRFLRGHTVRQSNWWNWVFPAPPEAIIVDEASMLDTFLMARLVRVCTPFTKLILVGDVEQLPSVGPGQVLRDLIASGCVLVVELTTNFRQREGSEISAAAEAIKAGVVPDLPAPGERTTDCYFLEANTAAEAARLIVKAVTQSLPARCGADPYQSIQVLTPKHRGTLGTAMLNAMIQEALHPHLVSENFASAKSPAFALGDRVLHTKNNYQLGVFNGESGSIHSINGNSVAVQYGERFIKYDASTIGQLTHGFAITIHRAQGSEYPFVVIPVHATQQPMLNRALLYTALTRARQMVVLVGSREAFAQAIANVEASHRQTGLLAELQSSLRRVLPPNSRSINS